MELPESEFNEMVLKSDRPVLVDFWASWCPPCKMMQPVIDRLADKVGDWADVYSVNIDRSPSLASLYKISGVPTFVAYAGGEVIDRRTGALTENQLIALLQRAEEAMPEFVESDDLSDDLMESDDDEDGLECADEENVEAEKQDLILRDCDTVSSTTDHAPADDQSHLILSDTRVSAAETAFDVPNNKEASRNAWRVPLQSEYDLTQENGKDSAEPSGPEHKWITIVSGLPRSGTSLMMRMLNAGGIPALCDDARTPDADNPNGYYEFQDVKSIQAYDLWIDRAPGHAVKMVYSLLKHLPADREYRVIFMRRHTEEILSSQRAMLERNGIKVEIPDDQLKAAFERELRQFYAWIPTQPHLKLINVSYNELLSRPDSTISHINSHLNFSLNTDVMTQVIDTTLYRNRAA
jgi:thioredoxin